jgi:hypothetical protein
MRLPGQVYWPAERPAFDEDIWGWFGDMHVEMFNRIDATDIKTIVESGSFLGRSAAHLAKRFPEAHLYCVDHWRGDPAWHQPDRQAQMGKFLKTMFERFQANMWPLRDRITIIRADDPPALADLAEAGVVPDLVYLDGSHEKRDVTSQLKVCKEHWGDAIITGDDWSIPDVQQAVTDVYHPLFNEVITYQDRAWRLL